MTSGCLELLCGLLDAVSATNPLAGRLCPSAPEFLILITSGLHGARGTALKASHWRSLSILSSHCTALSARSAPPLLTHPTHLYRALRSVGRCSPQGFQE